MKKVFIAVGHGGKDPGATGNGLREKEIALTSANECKRVLEAHGVSVKMSRYADENDPVNEEVKECNAFNPDVTIASHVNAGGGDGFEAYYSVNGGTGKTLAQNIEKEVKAIGQNSRGCKIRKNSSGGNYYAYIRNTKAPAVICEMGFIDNKNDVKAFDTVAEQKSFGVAYAKGILKTLGITYKPGNTNPSTPPTGGTSFFIRAKGSLNIRSGAGAECEKVGVIDDRLKYTIVETRKAKDGGTWGKLKSGIGWINVGTKYVDRVK